ncbi:MAG: LysM peptidoglycan-binding domain-containing protein [Bacteroidaceae bacterium]|nr:LysM peptidoglycan-binding domain-containing protein [Bacteroidaceae bacterium]
MSKLGIFAATILALLPCTSVKAQQTGYITHTVTAGQGVYSIARTYGVTEQEIYDANPGSRDVIRTGDKLLIPVHSSKTGNGTYTVKAGDTLFSLAKANGLTVDELLEANPGLVPESISVGQTIVIPAANSISSTTQQILDSYRQMAEEKKSGKFQTTHVVQPKETIYRISKQYGITQSELLEANPRYRYTKLEVGAHLNIPYPSSGSIKAEEARISAEKEAEKARLADEKAAEKARLAAEKEAEKARLAAEKEAENARLAAEKARLEAEKDTDNSMTVAERIAAKARQITDNTFAKIRELTARNTVADSEAIPADSSPVMTEVVSDAQSDEPDTEVEEAVTKTDMLLNPMWPKRNDDIINAALIMPFRLDEESDQEQRRMVEFYQGILLAVRELKSAGTSIHLHVYDTGTEYNDISYIFQKEEMSDMDILFGPRFDSHIRTAAEFADSHRIPLVLPVSSGSDAVMESRYIYQLNPQQTELQAEMSRHFRQVFSKPNLIILDTGEESGSQALEKLSGTLKSAGMKVSTVVVDLNDEEFAIKLAEMLEPGYQNIFMAKSSSSSALYTILPILQLVNRAKDPSIETHLFGYPEYQVFAMDHMDEFHEVDTWFYSWFYTNNKLEQSQKFNASFRQAYSRQMMQSFPSFAEYGYDMASYFLNGIAKYGDRLSDNLDRIKSDPIQMGFRFQRAGSNGGFVNRKVFFIHMSDQYQTEKIDFD